ncbi:MAG: hypothetical protein L3J47_00220 [Sulfurovum sp.]|nr:hypothetical protein [Sulfurovum sp.]
MPKDPKRVASGKKSKRKGSSQELKLAKAFQKWWGEGQFARSPGSGGWGRPQNRDGFNASGDIITTARDFPWCIEIKHVEGWTLDQLLLNEGCMIHGWWQQTVEETPVLLRPLLLFKKNRQQEVATVFSSDPVLALIDCRKFDTMDYLGRLITLFPLKFLLDLDPTLVRVCERSRGRGLT